MPQPGSEGNFRPDVDELILMSDPQYVGDTYIFEPSTEEERLGYLFAAAETEHRDGAGKELLDTALQALQREYYREPSRGVLASFESALHQANLILHDVTEQGLRDWMGYFHAAVGVLAHSTLHISTAGRSSVVLVRRSRVSVLSTGLSHSPITDPLRTFSHVASGMVAQHDMLLLATSHFDTLFRHEDLVRFAITHSAATMTTRLEQLYEDQGEQSPVAVLVATILAKRSVHSPAANRSPEQESARASVVAPTTLTPRQPLVIQRSTLMRFVVFVGRVLLSVGAWFASVAWPFLRREGRRGGGMLVRVSSSARNTVRSLAPGTSSSSSDTLSDTVQSAERTSTSLPSSVLRFSPRGLTLTNIQSLPRRFFSFVMGFVRALPLSSKIFGVLTILLTIVLIASFILLQHRRAEDQQIEHASEVLHEAQTKLDAAEAALIYDNRDQARTLYAEASTLNDELVMLGLYKEQQRELAVSLQTGQDRLEKILRITGDTARTVGDFSVAFDTGQPRRLLFVDGRVYTFNPDNNSIAVMNQDGSAAVVNKTTAGVGYFTTGIAHLADKTLVLATDTPGIALFDTTSETLSKQDISLPSDSSDLTTLAVFGNRLYVYDPASRNIFSYNKTLRGYTGGTAWIADSGVLRGSVADIGVDGFIYLLYADGVIHKLYKGALTDFDQEQVQPPLDHADRLVVDEQLRYLYVLDRVGRRVVVFDKEGALQRQVSLEDTATIVDIAVDPEETTLYLLDGTVVLAVSLVS